MGFSSGQRAQTSSTRLCVARKLSYEVRHALHARCEPDITSLFTLPHQRSTFDGGHMLAVLRFPGACST